jgi:hypothetical protein
LQRTPIVLGELLWKPFDIRFGEILDRMHFHQKVVKDEMQWAYLSGLKTAAEVAAKRAEDERQERIRAAAEVSGLSSIFSKEKQGESYI